MTTQMVNDMMSAYSEDAVDFANLKFGMTLDFSSESIEKVEQIADTLYQARPRGFLARIFRRGPSDADVEQICKMLGGYIGEVFRRNKGGDWAIHPDFNALGVQRDQAWIFPPSKVHKRLANGPEDNLWSYFRVVLDEPWESSASDS